MINLFLNVIMMFVNLLKVPVIIFSCILLIFYILVVREMLIQKYKYGNVKPSNKGFVNTIKRPSFFKKLFILAPKQVVKDIINKPQGFFEEQGMIIFEGEQGDGKTISLVEYATYLHDKYPYLKSINNLAYAYDGKVMPELKHWKQLINYKNSHLGVVAMMDETQNWFSSAQSKNFPPEMLSVVTQNRKNRRLILGTAQSFYMLAKNIRTQCSEVRRCYTLFGCITLVFRKKPICGSDGEIIEWKRRGMYWFVHDERLRESYNTYKVIESLAKSGFQDRTTLESDTSIRINLENKSKKKK